MKTYIFHGKVVPERVSVNFSGLGEMDLIQPDTGLHLKFHLNIALSEISVLVNSEIEIPDLLSLKNYITDAVSFFVDSIWYERGSAYQVEIDSCTYNDGNNFIVFWVDIDDLKEEGRWVTTLNIIDAYFRANDLQKWQLKRSLWDLRRWIKISYDTWFYCYRSIESIKIAFNDSWNELNEALNLSKTYTDDLREKHAKYQRHGCYTFMPAQERTEMLIRAKTILSRFVSYIGQGNTKLVTPDFPELC